MDYSQWFFPKQRAFFATLGKPIADGYELNGNAIVEMFFGIPCLSRQVVAERETDERALSAPVCVVAAIVGMVAYSGGTPHVVHRPDDFFPRFMQTGNVGKGEKALVYPIYANDIGLANPFM